MTLGLCFWILMLVWFVFGVLVATGNAGGYGIMGHNVLLFCLFALLGWHSFGPPLHG